MVRQHALYMIVMAPPGANVSQPQRSWNAEVEEARDMLKFCLRIASIQHEAGRYFALEHPSTATTWEQEGQGVY